uniref:C-type lectin domain-containing protein n=1 Tax=Fundulus heteroclitus TaxID=8078 RepID=A0A3Q2PA90_FUNHE
RVKFSYKSLFKPLFCGFDASNKHFTVQNVKQYVYIPTPRTWTSAQSYCREHYTDLAKIENEAEKYAAENITQADVETWIGLYRVPWTWSDKNPSLFRHWHPTSLNNNGGNQHCAVADSSNQWGDEKCDSKKVFICHQGDCYITNIMHSDKILFLL